MKSHTYPKNKDRVGAKTSDKQRGSRLGELWTEQEAAQEGKTYLFGTGDYTAHLLEARKYFAARGLM